MASRSNYAGPSSELIDLGFLKVWFSYQTVVAFQPLGQAIVVCQNEWGPTTGKHLNRIPHNPADRLEGPIFRLLWAEYCETGSLVHHPANS